MKFLKPFFVFFLLLSVLSCDSDDDQTTPVDAESIIGSWSMSDLQVDADFSSSFDGIPIRSNTQSVGENIDFILTFTETTYTAEGRYDVVTTGELNGVEIDTDRQSFTNISETGTYTLNDDGTIEFDGDVFNIETSDLEDFEISGDQELNISFDANGNLVITQNIDTTIEQLGIEVSINSDSRIVLSPF